MTRLERSFRQLIVSPVVVVMRLAFTLAKYLPLGFFSLIVQPPLALVVVLPTLRLVPNPGTMWNRATRRPDSHSSKSEVTFPENFFVPLRCLIVMSLGELKVWGVREALGDCVVAVVLGEREGLADVLDAEGEEVVLDGEGDGEVVVADPVGEVVGDELARVAEALALWLADGLAPPVGQGPGGKPQVGSGPI